MTQDEIIPLHIEDEYVRNYLWERALIAIDDPCPIGTPKEKEHMKHDKTFEAINKLKEVELELHRLKNALEMTDRALQAKHEWVELNKDEVFEIANFCKGQDIFALAKELGRKLKEKNT